MAGTNGDVSMSEAVGPDVCMYNYVVTAHKPEAVHQSVVGSFTAPDVTNLIIARTARIEIYTAAEDGLQGVLDVPIYGRIAVLELFRPPSFSVDVLLIITEKYQLSVLHYVDGELVPLGSGDISDSVGRPADEGIRAVIDPDCRLIAVHLYVGLLKVIPLGDNGQTGEAFNLRLDDLHVLDLTFLHTPSARRPLLAVLSVDQKHARHLRTYEVHVLEKDLVDGPWQAERLDGGAQTLVQVPAPLGGCLVLGTSSVLFVGPAGGAGPHAGGDVVIKATPMKHTTITAYERLVGPDRYLLGDQTGRLTMLKLQHEGGAVQALQLQPLGTVSTPSSISYISNYVCFIGSSKGDNQLVRLLKAPAREDSPWDFVEVIDTYPNLGPIIDMCTVDMERQGQCQIVTCSGVNQGGSLRVVRSGIGVVEQASVELPGIKGVWSLRAQEADTHDTYLVLSFVGETRVLAINAEEELDEETIAGFDADAELLQVTPGAVRLVSCQGGALAAQWAPPGGAISVVAANASQVLAVVGGSTLVLLQVGPGALTEAGSTQLGFEVTCLDVSPLHGDEGATLAALGTWDMRVCVVALPSLSVVAEQPAGREIIPRSVLLANCDGCCYLLCGMGDGSLVTHSIDAATGALRERKSVALGTKPINLSFFTSLGARHIFAASDRPTVLYSSKGKLLYANLNEREVHFLTSFNSEAFPDALAIAKEGMLTIGGIDAVQKLHVHTIPLGEMPRRIAHQPASNTFALLISSVPMATSIDAVRLLDSQTYETLDRLELEADEKAMSVCSVSFENDPEPYYVVGTAHAVSTESEPTSGRIIVFAVRDRRLHQVAARDTKATVFVVQPFQGKLLSCVGTRVQIFAWSGTNGSDPPELSLLCGASGQVAAAYAATRGDAVVVGDLMRSLQLFLYKPEEQKLEGRASEWACRWFMAMEVLDDECYVGADSCKNLIVVRKNSDGALDEERSRLQAVGEFHLGDLVNRFVHGSLVMRLPDSELANVPTLLFGTITGAIGLLASLPKDDFAFFERLQGALRKVIHGVGGLSHETWREYKAEMGGPSPCRNFVDGDLIEHFLELDPDSMGTVAQEMGDVTVEDISKRVEDMARLH